MTTVQVLETSVTNNYPHLDDHAQQITDKNMSLISEHILTWKKEADHIIENGGCWNYQKVNSTDSTTELHYK